MIIQKLFSEFLGTALLLTTVIGSGIMGENLSSGNTAIALLGNTMATGAMLVVLISMFGPISGAHFNPAVSLVMALTGKLSQKDLAAYVLCQLSGALLGVVIAHAMFDISILQHSTKVRSGVGQWLSEAVATFGLVLIILTLLHQKSQNIPMLVGLYITGAYWFTASTSFANPAVTLARSFTNTFSGIALNSVAPFVAAQVLGAVIAIFAARVVASSR